MSVPQTPARCTRTRASPACGEFGASVARRVRWPGSSRRMVLIRGARSVVRRSTGWPRDVMNRLQYLQNAGEELLIQRLFYLADVLQHALRAGRAHDISVDVRVRHRELERQFADVAAALPAM